MSKWKFLEASFYPGVCLGARNYLDYETGESTHFAIYFPMFEFIWENVEWSGKNAIIKVEFEEDEDTEV